MYTQSPEPAELATLSTISKSLDCRHTHPNPKSLRHLRSKSSYTHVIFQVADYSSEIRGMTMGAVSFGSRRRSAVRCQAVLPTAQLSIALTSDRVTGERNEPSSFSWNVSRRFTLGAGRKLNGL